jgi:hypothetical protein
MALYDLGLTDIVGRDWVTAEGEAIEFAQLGLRQADRLVRRLEDLTAAPMAGPSPATSCSEIHEQLTLF